MFLALIGFAHLLSKQNQIRKALHLIGLTRKYPTPFADIDHYSDLVLKNIKQEMPEATIFQEIERGKALDFESTLNRLLDY